MSVRICLLLLALAVPGALLAQAAAAPPSPAPAAAAPPETTLPLKHAPKPTGPAITAADLMTRLYIFADDSMQGREAGTAGNVKGTDYIARELKRMGLVPAGDDGTYFQTLPFRTVAFDDASSFEVGGMPLTAFTDYVPSTRQAFRRSGLASVYGGLATDSTTWPDAEAVRGRLAVLALGPDISLRRLFRASADVPGAAAVALVVPDSLLRRLGGYLRRPRTVVDEAPAGGAATPRLLLSESAAGRIFASPLDGLAAGAPGATVDLDLRFDATPVAFPARNVVGIIPGSDPKLRHEYVAIGAHNDHIGMSSRAVAHDSLRIWNHVVRPEGADDGGKQATAQQQQEVDAMLAAYRAKHPGAARMDSIDNGADDDGSGTVSALEIAERIASMKQKPKRSMLFVFHVGEEKGLLGSRYFTDHPTVPRDSIVAQLNMDMVGRGDATDETGHTKDGEPLHGSPGYLQLVGSRRLSTELGDLVETVNRADGHGLTFDYSIDANGHPANIYCRSDHAEYARFGIPIVFFTTGLHSDYHQVTDEPEYIDYPHMAKVANLVEDVALHVANLDHRVVVDHPKPDPAAPCRQ